MKLIIILQISILISPMVSPTYGQQDSFMEEYLERLENSKKYLLQVAETMPEDKFAYKPTPESMSFAENLMHIGWAMDWHSQSLLGGREARDWNTDTEFKVDQNAKNEMVSTIEKTFDKTMKFVREFDVSKLEEELDYFGLKRTKRQVLMLLADHITHHRGQMLVYLRLNTLQPPRYVLYQ